MQASAVQIMNMHVPTCVFHDRKCHHRGMTERKKLTPENTVSAVLEAVILAHSVGLSEGHCATTGGGKGGGWRA